MALSQAKGPCGDNTGYESSLLLHHLSVIALTVAIVYDDEQLPWFTMLLAQFGYSSLKLYESGTMVSLFPVLHKNNCCLLEAWALRTFLTSISLYPSNNETGPTSNEAPMPFLSAMYESSLTSVV